MKVLIVGATGMVGQGALKACLESDDVSQVVLLVRNPITLVSSKVQQIKVADFEQIQHSDAFQALRDLDASFYCLGVTSAGLTEAQYLAINHGLTLKIAKLLKPHNPDLAFIYVSGTGTDRTEQGRAIWARVKGKTENDLERVGFAAFHAFRPGLIQPLDGIESKTNNYRLMYKLMTPLFPLLKRIAPNSYVTTRQMGNAMINAVRDRATPGIAEVKEIIQLAAGTAK
ncbi:NAD-dependent epimerase/dehydratase family protein [Ferrimonas lipolytica]|uniref:Epimerase n=1 Tax=Ferrimonas lipolytica TaxID=2724191 RepID=A0A6H1U9Q0_9GAMM|nr:NAD-dependent epimerase/dehydratase family protein [Ferrimonas lipolytica]QIZ75771.1 epimerase [Ferrimonas lipolytica]